jgi:membrane protease YdiL (CAAX protease family)
VRPAPRLFVVEALALAVIAVAPVPVPMGVALLVASLSIWVRGGSWAGPGPAPGGAILGGAAVGAAALGLALVVSPGLADVTGRAVEWNQYPMVRGSAVGFTTVAVLVVAQGVAAEMAFRGWLLPRIADLAPRAGTALAAVGSALAEALVTRGHLATRAGAFVLGLGGAVLYLGARRRLAAPIACRLVFDLGALALGAFKLVG